MTETEYSYILLTMSVMLTLVVAITRKIRFCTALCCSCEQNIQTPRNRQESTIVEIANNPAAMEVINRQMNRPEVV